MFHRIRRLSAIATVVFALSGSAIAAEGDSTPLPDIDGRVEQTDSIDTALSETAAQPQDTTTALAESAPQHKSSSTPALAQPDPVAQVPRDTFRQLPKMVVVAPGVVRDEATYRQSSVVFTADDIRNRAGTVDDISRYIGTLPSAVSSLSEGYDNTFFVRGGRPSEVTFLVDGIEMENINHFSKANGSGGPISFLNTDYIGKVGFYAGNMPVSLPSRMSSVVDIGMKSGSLYDSRKSLGCKLTGGLFSLEGPILSGKSSYAIAGRYVDFMPVRTFIRDAGVPKLGDVYGKLFAIGSDNFELSSTGLFSFNNYRYGYPIARMADNGVYFQNMMNQVQTIYQGGAGVSLHYTNGPFNEAATVSASFRNGVDADSLGSFADTFFTNRYSANPITSGGDSRARYGINSSSSIRFGRGHKLSFGFGATKTAYEFSHADESEFDGECVVCNNSTPVTYHLTQSPVEKKAALENAELDGYAGYDVEKGIAGASGGIRADYYRLLDKIAFSPRFSTGLRFARAGTLSASMGLYHQFPVDLPTAVFDLFSSSPDIDGDSIRRTELQWLARAYPERCWQTSIGYDKNLFASVETRVEAYTKWYDREYSLLFPGVQEIFTVAQKSGITLNDQKGKRKTRGVELSFANSRRSPAFYSIGTSIFDVKDQYSNGNWYHDWMDVGYTYSVSLGGRFYDHHCLSVSLQGAGGRPYSPQTIVLDCIDRKSAVFASESSYYSGRLDKLAVANLRYVLQGHVHGMAIETSLEVLNILNYKPTLEYRFNGNRFVEVKPFSMTPIIGFTASL